MGWWRRNRWGLIALVPAVAAILWLSSETVTYYNSRHETDAIAPDADGFYTISDRARMRLVSITKVTDVKDHLGKPYTMPSDVAVWRATIAFQVKPDSYIGGCDIRLEDAQGRTYSDDASAVLPDADVDSSGCLDPSPSGEEPSYTAEVLFGLPTDAQPVAVRIHTATSLPRYVRLTR
jgi:hypothetical protein